MPNTIRITKGTFDSENTAPDGSHRFPAGLVVGVGEGYGKIEDQVARRWVRNGFAEEFDGEPGSRVSNEDVSKSPAELAAEIANLQALYAQATSRQTGSRITRAGAPGEGSTGSPALSLAEAQAQEAGVPEDRPIGRTPYQDPQAPHPLAGYDLTEKQRTSLERAGFTRPEHVERASDDELLEVDGIGESALRKLRGG